ncbi:MAG: FAD-binding oxidoreductase, partial [Alphaproteobacteria bacterium]|nr:FAD-binding oxidoreductase [Alphaproteobacteria bacterium]
LLMLVRRAGAEVLPHTPVTAARRGGAGYALTTPAGDIETAAVAIAAGPWSAHVAALFGHVLVVRPSLIVLSVTAPAPPVMDALVTHVTGRLTMKQFANGSVLIGGGWPGRGQLEPYAPDVDGLVVQHNLAYAAGVVPALARLALLRSWGGFEAETADGLPLLGHLSDDPPLVLCLPTAAGWTAGPLMGRLAAAMVSGDALPEWARPMAHPRT